jgi:hypothetical protein
MKKTISARVNDTPIRMSDAVPPLTPALEARLAKIAGSGNATLDKARLLKLIDSGNATKDEVRGYMRREVADMMITGATRITPERASDPDQGLLWEGDPNPRRVPGSLEEALAFLEARGGLLSDEEVEKVRGIMEKYVTGNSSTVNQAGISANTSDRARSTRAALDSIVAVRQSTSKIAAMNSANREMWSKSSW